MNPAQTTAVFGSQFVQAPHTIRGRTVLPITRIIVTEPVRPWGDEVKARFDELCALERGWDGYQGVPVSFTTANFALRMLEAVCGANAPAPQIVPGTDGDLQIEWHTDEADIELHVRAPNDVHAWRSMPAITAGEEQQLNNDFKIVAAWIKDIAEPLSAAITAAA
jgi:hypothetical protein